MSLSGWLQIALVLSAVLVLAKPLGLYMARVFTGETTFLSPVLGPVERGFYALAGVRADKEQTWLGYALGVLLFSLVGFVVLYAMLRLQGFLPLNPQGFAGLAPDLAFNTAASFVTNTNWQSYGGETTMSHLSQMLGPRHRVTLPEWVLTLGVPILSVGATTLFGLGLTALVALQNLSMLYLAAVLLSAVIAGRSSALLAAVLSFVAYNFFFIEPTGALTVAQPQEVLSLVIFIAVALAAGQLAARLREQATLSRQQARQSQALLDFSRKLSAAHGQDSVLDAIASHLHTSLGRPALVLVPDAAGDLALTAAWPPEQPLDGTELTAARWAFDKREPAGFLTGTLPQIRYLFRPIVSAQRSLGVAGLAMGSRDIPLTPDEERTWTALLDQSAIAMDRARLNRESALASVAREGEKVQAALLSSLSHDLRTPLASIIGAITTLRQLGDKMSVATRDDLLLSIEEESGRLNRFVANLFDMTRIEAGIMKARRDPIELGPIIEASASRVRRLHPDLVIDLSLAPKLPIATGDATLLEQVLFNLLDNARKYVGAEQPVSIFARAEGDAVIISVTDQGAGVAAADLEKIFDKFYRRAKGDGRPAGTGLGLSIARGLMTAMGGSIKATSPATRKRGTRFILRLPLATKEN